MYHLVLLLAAAALLGGGRSANVNRHMKLLADLDNHIESSAPPSSKRFITLTKRLPSTVLHRSGALELTCEAIAAPAPTIHWFKNDAPVFEYDKESTEIIDTNPSSLARISSTLLVPHTDNARYTCLVVAGGTTAHSSAVVYTRDGSTEVSERSKLTPLAPRILVSYKVFVDTIGNGVVLPCRARGHPRPLVVWTDNNGVPVKNDQRMRVLRSGELVISSLQWDDMGEFTCSATNLFGTTHITTFIYPARASETDG